MQGIMWSAISDWVTLHMERMAGADSRSLRITKFLQARQNHVMVPHRTETPGHISEPVGIL